MNWSDLLGLVTARDPAYLRTIQGVPREEVARCEENARIRLPGLYVDFLVTMGAGSGAFHPFGATQTCTFAALIAELPTEDYPEDRYFKVAFESDPSMITFYDMFLDLGRSDGEDAPLVTFETGGEFAPHIVTEVGFTVAEWLSSGVFASFELRRRPQHEHLGCFRPTRGEIQHAMEAALELFVAQGLEPALPPLPRVACLRDATRSVLLTSRGTSHALGIEVGADSRAALAPAIEQILQRLPGTKLHARPGRRR